MKTRQNHPIVTALLLTALLGSTALAKIDRDTYWSDQRPTRSQNPANGQPPWTPVKDAANPGTIRAQLQHNQFFYIGVPNKHLQDRQKVLTIVITSLNAADFKADQAKGHYGPDGKNEVNGDVFKPSEEEKDKYPDANIIKVYFPDQPDWEWVRIKYTGKTGLITITFEQVYSNCNKKGEKPPYHDCYYESGTFGGSENMIGNMAITQIYNFPRSTPVDTGAMPTFAADPNSGNWTHAFVSTDPFGGIHPCGVVFSSDGAGLAGGEPYYYEFTMTAPGEHEYLRFIYDADTGDYYPMPTHTYPTVRLWQSARDHMGAMLGIDLVDGFEDNAEFGPAVETRLGGIQRITADFDRPVVLLDPDAITVTDGFAFYTPDSIVLETDSLLALTFVTPLPENSCITVNLNDAIENLSGPSYCRIRSITGDVTGDGLTNDDDETLLADNYGQPVDEYNARFDLDLDMDIDADDSAVLQANLYERVFCSEPPVPQLTADISGPQGYPDDYVNLLDFAALAAQWLACENLMDPACSW